MNIKSGAVIILLVSLFTLVSCTDKEEEERKRQEELAQQLAALSSWTNPNKQRWYTAEKYDPFSGFFHYWLFSPIGKSNDDDEKVRMSLGCSTDPEVDDWVYFVFEKYLDLDLSVNEITIDNLHLYTKIFWIGNITIKVFNENKTEKVQYPVSHTNNGYILHADNSSSILNHAIKLGNSETSMLLKIPLNNKPFTYFSLDFIDINKHYTEFKKTCP
jgi:hypothetical protein